MTKIKNHYTFKPASGNTPKQIVLLLHGLGSNGQDLISLAPYWAKNIPNAVFISPDAPFPRYPFPMNHMDSHQWFSLDDRAPDKIEAGIKTALPILSTFMDECLAEYNLPANKMVLVGFSQGTMMSLYTAPRYKDSIAGVLGYSGALFGGEDLKNAAHKPPVCLIHGDADDVVPPSAYHHAKETLTKSGFDVSGTLTPHLPHSIDEKGIAMGDAFLQKVLN